MDDLRINQRLTIPARELRMETSTASGPGGQHANRARTRVTLIFDVRASEALGDTRRAMIERRLAHRIDRAGTLRVTSGRARSQADNLGQVRQRMADLIGEALRQAKVRRPTRPTRASTRRAREAKRRQGARKRDRGWTWGGDG